MEEMVKLQQEIEGLRHNLHELVHARKNFGDKEVTDLSVKLDELIVKYEKLKK